MKIAICTDKNSAIYNDEAKEKNIFVLNMPFTVGDNEYFEDETITQEEYYTKVLNKENVSTSQPSEESVKSFWREILKEYDEIVHIPMSSNLSKTCENAIYYANQDEFKGKVYVVDNKRFSLGTGQSVKDAVELKEKGKTASEIKKILEKNAKNCSIYVIVENLDFLRRGGRISHLTQTLGSILHVKPVLSLNGEGLEVVKKCIGSNQARRFLIDIIKEDIKKLFNNAIEKCHIVCAYTNNFDTIKDFIDEVKKEFKGAIDFTFRPLALSGACHVGPGALGLGVSKEIEE